MQALMNAAEIEQTVTALARRLAADASVLPLDPARTALVGIRSRGEILAARLGAALAQATGVNLPVGALDITMYRDDLAQRRAIVIPQGTDMNFRLDERVVVLVDDVLETGRSVRAALDALVDFGRPRLIKLLTLVDRGGREYPIAADYVGVKLEADPKHRVVVHLRPTDEVDQVFLKSK